MSDHTAGNWTPAPDQNFNGWDVIPVQIDSPEGPRVIAMVLGSQSIPEPMANANLIAAAPALEDEINEGRAMVAELVEQWDKGSIVQIVNDLREWAGIPA